MAQAQAREREYVEAGEERPAAPQPRRSRSKKEPRNWRGKLRIAATVAVPVSAAAFLILAFYSLDRFLAGDPRFILDAQRADAFRIEGIVYTSRAAVESVFAPDFGRSIYLVPLHQRRNQLLELAWVREASISRRWPNRLVIRIVERQPVAFAALTSNRSQQLGMALIDIEGVILETPERGSFSLPVLFGVSREQSRESQRERVAAMLRLIEELKPYAAQISEIDATVPEEMKITMTAEGRAVRLLVGKERFLSRVGNFLQHFPEIGKRLPNATLFDLRLDDRITAVEATASAK